jgi:2-C-methyl-D-erythritol 4-phosphate cytidylyltransferase
MSQTTLPAPCAAIIVAAGSSRRMGMDKLTWPLAGVPVLHRTINAFLRAESIGSVVVVCPQERWRLLDVTEFAKPVTRVDGGADRQDSVAAGLAALDPATRFVAVHDGARPLIAPSDIDLCVAAAFQHRAAALARRATETMKRSDANDFSLQSVSREQLWCMETPQVFEAATLRQACSAVRERGLHVTDEVSAVESIGIPVKFIESRHPNLKITTPADLALAEALLNATP